jgi:glycine hydroxymethyltransferase
VNPLGYASRARFWLGRRFRPATIACQASLGPSKKSVQVLDEVHIYTNKNMIPNDRGSPFDPCGLRIGTPAITTRGMKESEMKQIAEWYVRVLRNPDDAQLKEKVRNEVLEMIKGFPLYKDLDY